ncbi:heme/copper-type cytochrome/quinol oxidase subunit 2 [Staphylococcus hominis]
MIIAILLFVLIINLLEALYIAIKCLKLKKRNATDKEYKKMVNKVAPLMSITLVISIIVLVISWIIS